MKEPVLPSPNPSLLLLSSPPNPPTTSLLSAAYHPTLAAVVPRLQPGSSLVVVLAAPILPIKWNHLQSLLARLYDLLIASLGFKNSSNDINVSLLLVDHAYNRQYPPDRPDPINTTTILDLGQFALTKQRWANVFHASCEAGYGLLNSFLKVAERAQTFLQSQLIPLPGGLSLINAMATTSSSLSAGPDSRQYRTVCLGGTFDHLHVGHKLLLHAALLLLQLPRFAESGKPAVLIVGISGDLLLKNKKFASELEDWSVRVNSVLSFLTILLSSPISTSTSTPRLSHTPVPVSVADGHEIRAHFRSQKLLVRCVNLADPFGPTISEEDLDALVVSAETRAGGAAINDKRREKEFRPLQVFEIDVLNAGGEETNDEASAAGDFTTKISSTEIRRLLAESRRNKRP